MEAKNMLYIFTEFEIMKKGVIYHEGN